MSSSITTKKVPPFVIYLISFSLTMTVSYGISDYFQSLFGTSNSAAYTDILTASANTLLLSSVFIGIEFVLLRNSFGMISFLSTIALELGRLYYLVLSYPNSDLILFLSLNMATFFGIFVSKFFRSSVDSISSKTLTKNINQAIPAVAIILIFAGSTLMSAFGFAPISQEHNPQYFDVNNVNFGVFKVPSWNAHYFLDNILDQFQAGMNDPFKPVFNVTNNSPDPLRFGSGNQKISSYLKQETYFNYEYDAVKAKSGTFFPADTGITTQNLYLSGTKLQNQTFSTPVPNSLLLQHSIPVSSRTYNAYNLTVSYPINHTSLFDESLPVPWNSRTYGSSGAFYGSFINPNSTQVYSKDGKTLLYECPPSGALSSCGFTENEVNIQNFPGVADVGLRLDGFPNSGNGEILNYTMNYLEPNINDLSSYSGTTSLYQSVFSPAVWSAIKHTYLQLPSDVNGTAPPGNATYQDWAPLVYQAKTKYFDSTATVMSNIYALLSAMEPAIDSNYLGVNQSGGAMGLKFDADYWINGTYINHIPGVQYPAPGQDYVNWFLTVKNGLSSNFASASTMILRSEGIPARFVTGYALGNTSDRASTNPYVTVYQRLHKMAWTEALVPLSTPYGLSFEWVIVDPIGAVLASLFGNNLLGSPSSSGSSSQSSNFIAAFDAFTFNQTDNLNTTLGQINFGLSISRVGVDQKNSTGQFDNVFDTADTGYLGSNGFNPDPQTGMVKIGVYVENVHTENGSITSFSPAGSIPVTFQAGYFNNGTGEFIQKDWNDTSVKSVVISNAVTGYAETFFQYKPYYNNLTTPLHGTGPLNFIAIPSSTYTANSAFCNNGAPLNCTIGISDHNRTDDSFSINNFQQSSIKYDPMQLVLGTPPMQSINSPNTIQSIPTMIYANALTQNTFSQKIISENRYLSTAINQNLTNIAVVVLVVGLLQYVLEEKRK